MPNEKIQSNKIVVLDLTMASQPLQQSVQDTIVYTKASQNRGNGLFAAQDVQAKEHVLFIARPLMVALESSKLATTCYHCLKSPENSDVSLDSNESQSIKKCGGCKVVKFCNQVSLHSRSMVPGCR